MEDKTSELISIVKAAFPLVQYIRRNELVRDKDKKLMSDLGLSLSSFSDLLDEVASQLDVKIPDDIRSAYKFSPRTILKFLPPRRRWAYQFDIPDLSINQLVAIVELGYWPHEYFREADPQKS